MAWTTPVDYSTGQVITAAIWNNLIGSGGNIDETAPAKVTTAGDLVYGTGANAIARLGVGSANQVLKVNSGATAPEWSAVAASELTAGNDKVFYSNSSGAVTELALGAASTVLTSNGTTSAPTFEAAAAGGSITATASGAISGAGISVSLNSDGTVSAIVDGRVAASASSITNISSYSTDYTMGYVIGIYDDAADAVVVAWEDNHDSSGATNNYKFKTAAASISGSTLTFGTVVEVDSSTGYPSAYGMGYDPDTDTIWYGWHKGNANYNAFLRTASVSGNTITFDSSEKYTGWQETNTTIQNNVTFCYDTDTNQMIFAFGQFYQTKLSLAVVSESGGTITVNTPTVITTTNYAIATNMVYMEGPSRLVVMGGTNGGTRAFATYSISGTTISADQQDAFTGHGVSGQQSYLNFMVPTSNANKLLYGNFYVSTNADIEYNIITVTAGSATTRAYTASLQLTDHGNSGTFCCDRVGTTGDTYVIQSTYNNIYTAGTYAIQNIGTATPTLAIVGALVTDNSHDLNHVNLTMQNGWMGSSHNKIMGPLRGDPSSVSNAECLLYTPASGSTTANKFVGISEAAVSDGASGTFTVISGTNTGVSGLTTGETYFLQADGSLSTSKDDINYGEVGKALSATSILLSGVGDTSVSST